MTKINQNFSMYSGDTKFIDITIVDGNDVPVEITGTTIKWVVKRNVRSSVNNVLKTTTDGISIIDPLVGKFQVKLDPEDTDRLSGEFYHEAELKDVQGNVSTILTGTLTIIIDGI